jgi:hypothetical protein
MHRARATVAEEATSLVVEVEPAECHPTTSRLRSQYLEPCSFRETPSGLLPSEG